MYSDRIQIPRCNPGHSHGILPFNRSGIFLYLLSFIMLMWVAAPAASEERKLRLAVHPYLPSSELIKRFKPLADHLSSKIGRPVQVDISPSYAAHIERVGWDEVDIAYVGPASFIRMSERFDEKPILGQLEIQGETTFQGAIVVRKDSSIKELSQLRGERFAFGDPNSTMSHLVPRFMLHKAGIDVSDFAGYEYLHSHNNVALGVLTGNFAAGAVKEEVFLKYRQRGLRALLSSPPIPTHVFVASSALSPEIIEQLTKAMLELGNDVQGRVILSTIRKNATGLQAARHADFDDLGSMLMVLDKHMVLD